MQWRSRSRRRGNAYQRMSQPPQQAAPAAPASTVLAHATPAELEGLNAAALGELSRQGDAFAKDVIAEAGRLEAAQHTTAGDPEITSTMIDHAARQVRMGLERRPMRRRFLVYQTLVALGAIVVGVATNVLDKPGGAILFAV